MCSLQASGAALDDEPGRAYLRRVWISILRSTRHDLVNKRMPEPLLALLGEFRESPQCEAQRSGGSRPRGLLGAL